MTNVLFDSNEEILFNDWCTILKTKGYILDFYKNINDVFEIIPKKEYCLNLKQKSKCFFLMHPFTYRYDFKIIWSEIAINKFIVNLNNDDNHVKNCYFKTMNNVSYIDVKGEYTRKNRVTDITFPIIQKVLYHFYDIYVQKIVPVKLFENTFATDNYLLNNNVYKVGTKKGTNKRNFKTLNSFLNDDR